MLGSCRYQVVRKRIRGRNACKITPFVTFSSTEGALVDTVAQYTWESGSFSGSAESGQKSVDTLDHLRARPHGQHEHLRLRCEAGADVA